MNNKTYFKNQTQMGKITAGIIGIISLFYIMSCSSEIEVLPIASTVKDPQAMLASTNGVITNGGITNGSIVGTPPSPIEDLQVRKDPHFNYKYGFVEKNLLWNDWPTNMGTIDGSIPATFAGYVVKYKTENSDFIEINENSEGVRLSEKITPKDTSIWISGLRTSSTYTFLLAASNSAGLVTPDADAATVTTTTAFYPPMKFQVASSTRNQVVLSWEYPPGLLAGIHYHLSYKEAGDSFFSALHTGEQGVRLAEKVYTNTTATVLGLNPNGKYTFALRTFDAHEYAKGARILIDYAYESTPPAPLKNLSVLQEPYYNYDNGFIGKELYWDYPSVFDLGTIYGVPSTLAGFVVKYKTGNGDFIEINKNSKGIRISEDSDLEDGVLLAGLSTNSSYTFLVASSNSGGMVTPDADAATVVLTTGSPPMSFQVDSSTDTEVKLSWDYPDARPDYHYRLSYRKAGDDKYHITPLTIFPSRDGVRLSEPLGMNTHATVLGLSPNTKYTFIVRAYTDHEIIVSPRVLLDHITEPGATPPSAIERLQVLGGYTYSYKNGFIKKDFFWDVPTNTGTVYGTVPASIVGYVVKYKTGNSDFIEIDENSEGVRLSKKLRDGNYASTWIDGLSPNTSYTFLVAASNSGGAVTPDADATTVTIATEPLPMSFQVDYATDTEVTLSWHYPDAPSSYFYEIRYKKAGSDDFELDSRTVVFQPDLEGVHLDKRIGTNTTATVMGLSPDTKYTFGVRAYSDRGVTKSPSVQLDHTTAPEGKGAIPPSHVEKLRLIILNSNQVKLNWNLPTNTGSIDGVTVDTITGYSVWYKEADDSIKTENSSFSRIDENSQGARLTAALTDTSTTATITGLTLKPGLTYTFSVVAKNHYGEISYTDRKTQARRIFAPAPPPTLFRAEETCKNNQVSIAWDRSPGATRYNVRISKERYDDNPVFERWVTTNFYTDTDLTPDTASYYRVNACNANGCSDYSPTLVTATTSSDQSKTLYGVVREGRIPMDLTSYDRRVKDIFSFYKPGATIVARYVKLGGTGDGSSFLNAAGNPKTVIDNIKDASQNKVYVLFMIGGQYGVPHGLPFSDIKVPYGVIYSSDHIDFYGVLLHEVYTPDTISMKPYVAIVGGVDDCLGTVGAPVTTLDGQGDRRVFHVEGGGIDHSAPSLLYGVTIAKGMAQTGRGGGMYIKDASPILSKVTFYKNKALFGGGLGIENSEPLLINVTFTGNETLGRGRGGGMASFLSSPVMVGTTFTENRAESGGGAMYNDNGNKAGPLIVNSIFWRNIGYSRGYQFFIQNDGGNIGTEKLGIFNSIIKGGTSGSLVNKKASEEGAFGFSGNDPVETRFQAIFDQDPLLSLLSHGNGWLWVHPIPGPQFDPKRKSVGDKKSAVTEFIDPSLTPGVDWIKAEGKLKFTPTAPSPAVDKGLYMKRMKGVHPPRDYFSPDKIRWYETPILHHQISLPQNTENIIDINVSDATGYIRTGRPDLGAYEGR